MERRELILHTLHTATGSAGSRSLAGLTAGGTSVGQPGSELGMGLGDRATNRCRSGCSPSFLAFHVVACVQGGGVFQDPQGVDGRQAGRPM